MTDILNDLKTLTTIPRSALDQLSDKAEYIIGHSVFESMVGNESLAEIDLGIGCLNILNEGNLVKYKFIPSPSLEKIILETLKSSKSPLTTEVEESLQKKVMDVYKTLF